MLDFSTSVPYSQLKINTPTQYPSQSCKSPLPITWLLSMWGHLPLFTFSQVRTLGTYTCLHCRMLMSKSRFSFFSSSVWIHFPCSSLTSHGKLWPSSFPWRPCSCQPAEPQSFCQWFFMNCLFPSLPLLSVSLLPPPSFSLRCCVRWPEL